MRENCENKRKRTKQLQFIKKYVMLVITIENVTENETGNSL